jgi:PPOX class probable F420-dependent enzyme
LELPDWARSLLDSAQVAHLGLLDSGGRPRVLPITFAVVDTALWSAVDGKPKRVPGAELARVRWLRATPSAALTVDRYSPDWSRLAWVQLLCTASVVDEMPDDVLDALAARYPAYRSAPPGGPLIRLEPDRFVCWRA